MTRTTKGSRELRLSWYRSCDLKPTRTDTQFQFKELQNDVDWILILAGQTSNRFKNKKTFFQTHSSVHRNSMLIKIQPDATECRYLFTAKSLYMFWVSQHPSSGVLKIVKAASGTDHNTGTATSLQRDLIGTATKISLQSSLSASAVHPCIMLGNLNYAGAKIVFFSTGVRTSQSHSL